ncbi:MAG: hypothetical protein JWP25_7095 [Bradyrhizobium sp.]|jgi:hypothetical protein|nr:hypothetical protein [Bradyrhizobium sp.]
MKHQGFEYTVVQGIERGVWKWSASVEGVAAMGQEPTNRTPWPQPKRPSTGLSP